MRKAKQLIGLGSLIFSLVVCAKVIYGEDNRIEVHQGTLLQQKLAKRAAVLIHKRYITEDGRLVQISQRTLKDWLQSQINGEENKSIMLLTQEARSKLQNEVNFCANVRFTDQPSTGECSGFLISPDLLLTAGHCSQIENFCSDHKWVFDYTLDEGTKLAGVDLPAKNVYGCKRVVTAALNMNLGLDYALVQLDRRVVDRTPLELRSTGKISDGASVLVIGSPSGLPLKIAPGAKVRENTHPYYFRTNLDSFQGNSGSAVFNAATGVVEGILVRGEEDFNFFREGMCLENNVCADEGCRGEDVTRLTAVPEIAIQEALNQAAFDGDLEVLRGLLELRTWVDFSSKDGVTALMKASDGGEAQSIAELIKNGADVNHQDGKGNSSLHHLAKILNPRSILALERLLNANASLELRNRQGDTPILVAAKSLNLRGVKILIASGANTKVSNYQGETILTPFQKKNDRRAITELRRLGVAGSKPLALRAR